MLKGTFSMRNRDYKQFAAGEYYHVYNRGTGKMVIFHDDEDHRFFILRLREALFPALATRKRNPPMHLPEGSFDLVCYCLMPNHFHLLIRQNLDVSISKLMEKICTSYSKYFNRKYGRVGSLFQDQFKAVRIETNEQLLWLSVYIHNNPLVANLTQDIYSYPYSSFLDYVNIRADFLCKKNIITNQIGTTYSYIKRTTELLSAEGALQRYMLLEEEC
jgi:putative transposase